VLFGREHVLILRPVERLIAMTTLLYHDQVKEPGSFHDEVITTPLADAELKLTKTLIEASTLEDFNLARYKDNYNEKLTALIHAKVEGREIVAPPASDHPKVINLMDALKESVEEARRKSAGKAAPKKMAPSARRVAGEKKKRKSG
jgi:DNA end-binding protein Ku